MKNITPCLWFDSEAEDAANLYVSIFKNSKIKHVGRYTEVGKEHHGKPAGSIRGAIDGPTNWNRSSNVSAQGWKLRDV